MIDCGEGSQLQLRRQKLRFSAIRHIFISHLHGDHMLGLPGLLSTLSLHEIGGTVHVYIMQDGIDWLKEFMRISRHHSSLDVQFHPIERKKAIIYEDNILTVETFPLYHGVPCAGFIFREKQKPRKILGEMVEYHQGPVYKRADLKHGADFVKPDGTIIPNEYLTSSPEPARSYAYCSDTYYHQSVIDAVKGVNTIYHEATYDDEKADKAKERGHSTARQAAMVAHEAGAEKLIIGHYSKSYPDETLHLRQASEVFSNVIAANEGMKIDI